MQIEKKLEGMGIKLPELGKWDSKLGTAEKYYGEQYGKMKPFHRSGNLLDAVGPRARPAGWHPCIRAASAPR